MSFKTTAKRIEHMGATYNAGEVEVTESDQTISLSQLKKSFISSKMIPLGKINYDASTRMEFTGQRIRIGDASFETESPQSLDAIKAIVTKPYRAERERREKMISSANSSLQKLLVERANILENLQSLKAKPRKTLLLGLDVLVEGQDPLTAYRKKLVDSLNGPYSDLKTELESLRSIISEKDMQRIFATVYGVMAVQNSLLSGGDLSKPFALLEKASSKKLTVDNYIGAKQEDATIRLLNDAAIMSPSVLLGERLA